jgi:hypothetical protein
MNKNNVAPWPKAQGLGADCRHLNRLPDYGPTTNRIATITQADLMQNRIFAENRPEPWKSPQGVGIEKGNRAPRDAFFLRGSAVWLGASPLFQ